MKQSLRAPLVVLLAYISLQCMSQEATCYFGSQVRLDLNNNGTLEVSDPPLVGVGVRFISRDRVVSTNTFGYAIIYEDSVDLPHSETMEVAGTLWPGVTVDPAQHVLEFLPGPGVVYDTASIFLVSTAGGLQDVAVYFMPMPDPLPGTDHVSQAYCVNQGSQTVDVTLDFAFDPQQTWAFSYPPADDQSGNSASWVLEDLAPGSSALITIWTHVDAGTPLGTPVTHVASVASIGDMYAFNNVDTVHTVVVASWDPNNKQVTPTELTLVEGANGRDVVYGINFQNIGTAEAINVLVLDTLPSELEEDIVFLGATHPCSWEMDANVLRFSFNGIMLPDSASDPAGSHGSVFFRARTRTGLLPGQIVVNHADIYFDLNPPIRTAACPLSVALGTTVSEITANIDLSPNPASDHIRIGLPNKLLNAELRVVDLFGRDLWKAFARGDCEIDTRPFSEGVYFLQVLDDIGARVVKTFIIAR